MASSMAAAAAHSIPPFPLPAIPRVRPPAIPKGTPGPNTIPQPGPPPKPSLVWVDGRWASPHSRSAQHRQEVISKQLEKALQHEIHGMNVYAYKHIRTQQVVYSLTKNMDNTKILKQLMYHGKKTVPAALRRDVWRPYFSVHFPQTPAGALKGLRVFQELRELSALRQLKPPKELTIATQQDLDYMKKHFDPVTWLEKTENVIPNKKLLQPPIPGERLPKKLLAKRLMNQAATSVADVAAILTRQTNPERYQMVRQKYWEKKKLAFEENGPTPQEHIHKVAERRQAREDALSIRAYSRLADIRKTEGLKADQIEQRQQYLNVQPGQVKVDIHTSDRISVEYDGVGQRLAMIEEADQATNSEIGADHALQKALQDIKDEKLLQRQTIEKTMSAQVEQRLMELTDAEREQIEKEVEAERTQRQSEIDVEVATAREEYKKQRADLYAQPSSFERTQALRKLSRDSQAEVYAMKTDMRTRHLKWVGPFATVAMEVDKAMSIIDEKWESTLAELREGAQEEKKNHKDLVNHEVEIRWANLRDGTYAKSWPESVSHAELQSKATSRKQIRAVTTEFHYDVDEEAIETQYGLTEVARRNTVHVFGSKAPDVEQNPPSKGRYEDPFQLSTQRLDDRAMRVQEWTATEAIVLRDRIVKMRSERHELRQQFARSDVDEQVTPSIAQAMELVENARSILKEAEKDLYSLNPNDLKDMNHNAAYIKWLHPQCVSEIAVSENQLADEARVQYVMLTIDLTSLEIQNPEARHQANLRESFFAALNTREQLEDSIERFKDAETQHANAVSELNNFDLQHSSISDIFVRREAALENLPSEIEDGEAEITRLEGELQKARAGATEEPQVQVDIASLENDLKHERDTVQSKTAALGKLQEEMVGGQDIIREVVRNDKQAWLEFKRDNMASVFAPDNDSNSYFEGRDQQPTNTDASADADTSNAARPSGGMVMEPPEETTGRMGRLAKFFRWGR